MKPLSDEEIKAYYCSKHGENGEPTCPECWEHLADLLAHYNCNVVGVGIPKKKEDLR